MIGASLKLARARAGFSLREASAAMSDGRVSAQSIGKYERDEMMPGSAALMELARIYGVTMDSLMDQTQPTLTIEWKHILYKRSDGSVYGKRITELPKILR